MFTFVLYLCCLFLYILFVEFYIKKSYPDLRNLIICYLLMLDRTLKVSSDSFHWKENCTPYTFQCLVLFYVLLGQSPVLYQDINTYQDSMIKITTPKWLVIQMTSKQEGKALDFRDHRLILQVIFVFSSRKQL